MGSRIDLIVLARYGIGPDSRGGAMSDLETSTAEFLARVDRQTPDESKRVRAVLDELVRWSEDHAWGLNFSGRGAKGPVRYCVEGVSVPFWALTPQTADGARLSLPAAAHSRFPEELRTEARRLFARIDRRVPTPDEVPSVGCGKLLWAPYRDEVLGLMARALRQMCGVEEPVTA